MTKRCDQYCQEVTSCTSVNLETFLSNEVRELPGATAGADRLPTWDGAGVASCPRDPGITALNDSAPARGNPDGPGAKTGAGATSAAAAGRLGADEASPALVAGPAPRDMYE